MRKSNFYKAVITATLLGVSVALMGCNTKNTDNTNATVAQEKQEKNNKQQKVYVYETDEADYMDEVFHRIIEVQLIDDKEAIYRYTTEYRESYQVIEEYKVQYEKTDNVLKIVYTDDEYEYYDFGLEFILEKDKIVEMKRENDNMQSIEEHAGSYTATSEQFGDMTLVVEKNGTATLTLGDKKELLGSVYWNDGAWEFEGYNSELDMSLDWIIYFEGDVFMYIDYMESRYGQFAGSYKATGDLGDITFDVAMNGDLVAQVTVEGKTMTFTGRLYADCDSGEIYGLYATSQEGHVLELNLVDLGEMWNYSGSIAYPLSAG